MMDWVETKPREGNYRPEEAKASEGSGKRRGKFNIEVSTFNITPEQFKALNIK